MEEPQVDVYDINYPKINTPRYSFQSIQLSINNVTYMGLRSVSYGSIGETNYCEIEAYSKEGRDIIRQLGDRFHEKKFNLSIQFSEGDVVDTDTLFGVSIHSVESKNFGGPEPSTLVFKLLVPHPILFSGLKR